MRRLANRFLFRARIISVVSIGVIGTTNLCTLSMLAFPSAVLAKGEFAARMGTVYTTAPPNPMVAPRVEEIGLPDISGGDAIWGASGRDHRGHIWFGLSVHGGDRSAHLFEFVPESGDVIDRGDVVSELRKAGILRPGEGQAKIHTKIIQAADGYLYFASTDEEGETADGSTPPVWGSHLWRLDTATNVWEHLYSVPTGLTALAGNGRWIYALGLWDHVLYQYDTEGGALRQVAVGSVEGHMSRNFVVDHRGHVYVPRLWRKIGLFVKLVEFDTALNEVSQASMNNYADGKRNISRNHGIIGFAHLADGSIIISTHIGFLYRIVPTNEGPAAVESIGFFHSSGVAYASSLFSIDGTRYLAGVARTRQGFDWVVYDLESRQSTVTPLALPPPRPLVYGSITRDDAGRFYVVGRTEPGAPMLLRLDAGW